MYREPQNTRKPGLRSPQEDQGRLLPPHPAWRIQKSGWALPSVSWSGSPVLHSDSEAEPERGAEVTSFRTPRASSSRPLFIIAVSPSQFYSQLVSDAISRQFYIPVNHFLVCVSQDQISQQALPWWTSGIGCVCVWGGGLSGELPGYGSGPLIVRLYLSVKVAFFSSYLETSSKRVETLGWSNHIRQSDSHPPVWGKQRGRGRQGEGRERGSHTDLSFICQVFP